MFREDGRDAEKKYNPSKISELSRWLVISHCSIQNETSGLLLVFLGWTSSTLFFLHLANRFLIDCTISAIFQPDSIKGDWRRNSECGESLLPYKLQPAHQGYTKKSPGIGKPHRITESKSSFGHCPNGAGWFGALI